MLYYNLDKIFKARGIEKRFNFLVQQGFTGTLAAKVNRNKALRLDLSTVERLCKALRCTPNDLLEWVPDKGEKLDAEHPLNKIKQTSKVVDITRTLNRVPIDRLEQIERMIEEEIKKEPPQSVD